MKRSIVIVCLLLLSTLSAIAADVYVATNRGMVVLNTKNGHTTTVANATAPTNSVKATSDGTTVYGSYASARRFDWRSCSICSGVVALLFAA